jgi:hypothetical protein
VCAQVLKLTPDQAEQLLELRRMHLNNLHALYEDRQRLNLQVSTARPLHECDERGALRHSRLPRKSTLISSRGSIVT